MLVLSRRKGEQIQIGNGVTVTLISVCGNRAHIGIEAPCDVRILRQELTENTASGSPVSVKSMKGPAEKSGTN
jgi:carbon storage regulator